ncbi:MAG: VOC family protein [Bacteroidota bacterium]|jgi:catechol 2,3-dioxygenase-like lactoylglutathione lyase family enzyme|nr:VOC family protein [Bacteroidota bacterium]HHU96914.1 VOC family protein [Petrimonas sp.]
MSSNKGFIISGIQQVGIGVENLYEAWSYYIDLFNMDIRILEDDKTAELMLPYTGGKPQRRHACIAVNMQGGGGFEVWQYAERKPQPLGFELNMGDLGVLACKIKSRDVAAAYEQFSKNPKANLVEEVNKSIDGHPTFYMKDPYGNLFQVVQDDYIFKDEKKLTAGVAGATIGVTDIDRAMTVYRDILGYDTIVADETGTFADFKALPAGTRAYRRRLLTHSKPRKGSFSQLFGSSTIELVQALDRTPKKLYEGRFWGDPGFIQVCFDIRDMEALGKFCAEKGYPFTVDSSQRFKEGDSFDMGDAAGQFAYIEDPDGTLIEFVETHKVPIAKKLGLSLNLKNRHPEKPLPKWMLKALSLMRVKSEDLLNK